MSVAGEETPLPACDFCAGLPAVVYCRADSARLCLPCDRHVHGANTVSTRHARAPLCAACRAAAAAFFRRGGVLLCADCDFEEGFRLRRDGDPPLHDRGAVEVYVGCPSIADLAAALGVGGGEKAAAVAGDRWWWPAWEEPQVLRLEDVIVPTTSCHGLQPLLTPSSPKVAIFLAGTPPLLFTVRKEKFFLVWSLIADVVRKNRSSGGKLAEEVIRQLGELTKSEAAEAEQFPSWAPSEYAIGDGDLGAFGNGNCNEAASMSVSVPSCEVISSLFPPFGISSLFFVCIYLTAL
jgi:hypothetical protein